MNCAGAWELEGSAPQGLDVSSRGQRPRKRSPLTPSPPLAVRGGPKAGAGPGPGGSPPATQSVPLRGAQAADAVAPLSGAARAPLAYSRIPVVMGWRRFSE